MKLDLASRSFMSKVWNIMKNAIWVIVIIASLFMLFSSLKLFGHQMYIVESGSMEPEINTGSVVIDRVSGDYYTDDVVTYKLKDSEETITHRVVAVNTADGITTYTTKGDANNTPDPDPVSKANVVGKVVFSVPLLGYLLAFIRTLPGLMIFIIIPAIIIVTNELSMMKPEVKKVRDKRREAKRAKQENQEIEDFNTPPVFLDTIKPKMKLTTKKELIQ